MVRAIQEGLEFPEPVKPSTIAKSIAIGNPADGFQVVRTVKSTGGTGITSTDEEILQAMELLAETEGVFTEPAGGATLAGAIDWCDRASYPRTSRWWCASPATGKRPPRKRSARASHRGSKLVARSRNSRRTCVRRRIMRRCYEIASSFQLPASATSFQLPASSYELGTVERAGCFLAEVPAISRRERTAERWQREKSRGQ